MSDISHTPPAFDLSGRVVLITGGAGFLGRQHGAALAECGAHVIVSDVDKTAAQDTANELVDAFGIGAASAATLDVTDPGAIEDVRDQLSASGKSVDILVNNAAIDPKVKDDAGPINSSRLEAIDLREWDLQIAVGLTGAMLCARTFGSDMATRGQGVILNIASDLSVIAPDQRLYRQAGLEESRQPVKPVTYSVVKSGLIGLTRYLASYWADRGVRVNALSPGGIANGQNNEFVARLSSLIPLGRMAHPDEYRAAVQFLCSDASSYMTGQNIVIDGGRSII